MSLSFNRQSLKRTTAMTEQEQNEAIERFLTSNQIKKRLARFGLPTGKSIMLLQCCQCKDITGTAEVDNLPSNDNISHGYCPTCLAEMYKQIEAFPVD